MLRFDVEQIKLQYCRASISDLCPIEMCQRADPVSFIFSLFPDFFSLQIYFFSSISRSISFFLSRIYFHSFPRFISFFLSEIYFFFPFQDLFPNKHQQKPSPHPALRHPLTSIWLPTWGKLFFKIFSKYCS